MPKNDLKDEEICSLVLKKTIRSQKGSGKEKNQSGKVGEEREEAENSWWLFKRQMGYISRAFREEKGKLVQEGDRPWELITYVLTPPPSQYWCWVTGVPRLRGWRLTWATGIETGEGPLPSTINVGFACFKLKHRVMGICRQPLIMLKKQLMSHKQQYVVFKILFSSYIILVKGNHCKQMLKSS